ncbi:APC family permease [Pelotomaculum propionicicum]|uniref:Putative amino acid permease YhdG n=1 Tax=Pelotomaculum propionicicum TaxID=258475 RepID=A0A4Y7RPF4_9FIRM|nr:APC family permease [Pelotomaculum propionicicum]NLI13488.1 APC family permease [Peptococcaceae bacterium]TEB10620.1 putative amino acid permease YhdG [Pelotomaculum propionicicum]
MQLKRVLTLRTVVATSAGLTLASSSFVAAVLVANYVLGDTAWIAILIGGALCFLAAACFSELNGLLPTAAGIRLYFSRAFNDQVSLVISLLYMLIVVIGVVGVESFILSQVLSEAFPAIPPYLWIVVMLLLVTGMNLRGIKMAGVFQDVVTYSLIAVMLFIGFFALYKVGFKLNAPLSPGGATGMIQAVAVGVFLFVGFEWVTPLVEEVTQVKQISRGMMIALGILSVVYAVFTVAMTAVVPKATLVASPAPQLVLARTVLGDLGASVMILVILATSLKTFNAGIISVSRFMYASAREHVLPAVFSKISMRFFTPYVAIITLFFIGLLAAALTMLTGNYVVLVGLAAAMESIVYTLAGLAVISLRRKMSDRERPYLIKGGYLVPLLTALVFTLLAVAVLASDISALLYIAAAFVVVLVYVNTAVPRLKKKYEARKPAARRRPARAPEGLESK